MSNENEKHENNSNLDNVNESENLQEDKLDENNDNVENKDLNDISKLESEIDIRNRKIEQLESELNVYKDRLLRKAAEFENYKRRTENDQLNLFKYAAESFIIKLLPTADDFERSIAHINSAKDLESVKEGIKMIYDKFMKVLNDQGVVEIKAAGEPFNVAFHEALMQRAVPNVEPHIVLDVVEKGYMYKDRVIRHAKVIVSEELPDETADSNDEIKNSEDK